MTNALIVAWPAISLATKYQQLGISAGLVSRTAALLARAAGQFDVFVTVDRNLAFQQRIEGLPFAVVVFHARSNRLFDLQPLVPALLRVLPTLQSGEVTRIEA